MTSTKETKTSRTKAQTNNEAMEKERLFGPEVEPFMAMNRAQILQRICAQAGPQDVRDDDFWDSISMCIMDSEAKELLNLLIPGRKKQEEFIDDNCRGYNRRHRGMPDIDDLLEELYRDIANRKTVWKYLNDCLTRRVSEYKAIIDAPDFRPHALQIHFKELQDTLGLDDNECSILMVYFLLTSDRLDLGDFTPSRYNNNFDARKLAVAAGIDEWQIGEYFNDKGNLHRFNIVDNDGDIDRAFMSFLTGTSNRALTERFWSKSEVESLPWEFYGKIAQEHGQTLCEMVESKPADNGLSILFYGSAGSGKTSFAASLAHKLGKDLYFIAQNDKDGRRSSYSASFRYAALTAAQRQIDPDKCILVVDECDDMIESLQSDSFFGLFSMKDDGAETKGQLNTVIDENRHTVIWICNSQQNCIATSSRRRFDYSVLFDELLPETRIHIWENSLKRYNCEGKLTQEFIEQVSRAYKVNAGGIANAVKNAAALVAKDKSRSFEECTLKMLKAHCALLGIRKSNDERLEPARDYSLEGLNIKSGIRPERIIEVCRNFYDTQTKGGDSERDKPRMNLLMHGVPGSGKTEFVKYMAKQLGRKLNIKNASELLSKYVGGTEQLLAGAFAEAEKNGEILFIDEGDSMLAPRTEAQRSWEVSQVNTLLTEMENFSGIFVISTNLIQKLDPAALRRFTFRIHFDFLDNRGKEIFFNTYFKHLKLPKLTAQERDDLFAIARLTPSDFRNVRQQFFYLDAKSKMTNAEIINTLRLEASSRDSQGDYKGLGETRHSIGFGA